MRLSLVATCTVQQSLSLGCGSILWSQVITGSPQSQSTAPCFVSFFSKHWLVQQQTVGKTFWFVLKISFYLFRFISASLLKSQSLTRKKEMYKWDKLAINTNHHLALGQPSPPTAHVWLAPADYHPPPAVHTQAYRVRTVRTETLLYSVSLQASCCSCFTLPVSVLSLLLSFIDLWKKKKIWPPLPRCITQDTLSCCKSGEDGVH